MFKKCDVVYSRRQADGVASFKRKQGYNARVKKCVSGYAIYIEKKKK